MGPPARKGLQLRVGDMVAGVVTGPHERPGLDVPEPERERRLAHLREGVTARV
jgi:hypothetical protein